MIAGSGSFRFAGVRQIFDGVSRVESAVSLGPKFLDSRAISFSLLSLLEILSLIFLS